MPHWEEMQVKAKVLIEEALKILKSGMTEAEFLAGTTASAARLHMVIKRSRIEKYRLLHELGELVFEKAGTGQAAGIEPTKRMKDIIDQAKGLDKTIDESEKKLNKFSIVKKTAETKSKGKAPRKSQ